MENNQEDELTINNASYGSFNGFKVKFVGFKKIPYRFGSFGWPGGKYLLNELQNEFDKFSLTISKESNSTIDHRKKPVQIILNFDDIMQLIRNYWHQSKYYGDKAIRHSLGDIFPQVFMDEERVRPGLPKEISEIIPSKERVERAVYFLRKPRKYTLGVQDTLQLFTGGNVLHSLSLENILNEFEEKLSQNLLESAWQTFFEKNMLILNPGYIKLIPKANISSITAELPDFLLISIEGYVDIYEIKVPKTELLNYDAKRHNYYWSSHIAKAISQTENYIVSLDTNRSDLEKKIEKKYGLKLTILRPRGYIVAGSNVQLQEQEKKSYFRLLNESLRNTCIIPYDTFLDNFKNLSKTLRELT